MFQRVLIILIIIAVTGGIFLPACWYGFINLDDNINVYENYYLYPVRLQSIIYFWAAAHEGLYIPLTYTIWAIVAFLSRLLIGAGPRDFLHPAFFHGTNLILHICNGILVYLVLRQLLNAGNHDSADPDPRRREWAAGLGALFFLIHPVQVETVVWVTGMKDLLCGFFSLLALWQYAYFVREPRRRRSHYLYAMTAFILAILAKPSAVVIPLIGAVIDRWLTGRSFQKIMKSLIWWLIAAIPIIVVTKIVQPDSVVRDIPSLWVRPLVVSDAIVFYFSKVLLPFRLVIDYSRTPKMVLGGGGVYFSLLLMLGLGLLVVFRKIKSQWVAALVIFIICILPVSGIIPFSFQNISTVKDRYLYLALIGPAFALAWFFRRPRTRAITVIWIVIISFLGVGSFIQRRYWRNMVVLYTRIIEVNPLSSLAHNNLGNCLSGGGRLDEAGKQYEEALKIEPGSALAYYNLGNNLSRQEKSGESLLHYYKALSIDPEYPDAHYNLALELARRGETEESLLHYAEAVRLEPNFAEAQNNYGYTLAEVGRLDEAIGCYQIALQLSPDFAKAHLNFGNALSKLGETEEAIFHLNEALRIDPDYAKAHYNLAVIQGGAGRFHEALAHYTAALWINPDFKEARHNQQVILELMNSELSESISGQEISPVDN